MDHRNASLLALSTLLLCACASYPTGPSVMALPGSGATFEQFQGDDAYCQAYAQRATGTSAQAAAEQSAVNSAATGAAVGAAAGALIGAASGDTGQGAAVGAASGLLVGSAAGSDSYAASGARTQDRYDVAYVQCMYAKGHKVPVPEGVAASERSTTTRASAHGAADAGYPPPGTPPPPGY
jgi:hypothetical protein